ncbi:MAG: DsbA family oxidoreductase [Bacteroidetes bacterium]|nr:DsbA family oxidoreductase [Bacteroidota bacterium]
MKVEIWSDVMCPFCYIGKRRFEAALEQFPDKNKIEIEWKSFQLNPDMITNPNKKIDAYLAEVKGISLEQAKEMNERVTAMAKEVGLTYHFEKAIVANSFDAHRFSHFAKSKGLQDAAEERLFKANFTEGKNTADAATLVELGVEIGLDKLELKELLKSTSFSDAVQEDIIEARNIGVGGVPFFVFDRKYAVSGAQASEAFLQALKQSFAEYQSTKFDLNAALSDDLVCTPDGDCK